MKKLEKLFVKFLFVFLKPFILLMYPHKIVWVDKKQTKEVMKKASVFYSNHTSYHDGFLISEVFSPYKPYMFVGKDWYEKKNLNIFFRNLRYIPIDRQQMDTSWLVRGKEILNNGESIYFFPEGHTSKDGNMREFQPGFLMLSKQLDAPLIPICIDRKIRAFHWFRIIIGTPQYLDFSEPGRPSVVLKSKSAECRKTLLKLKKEYGNPKYFVTDVNEID